MRPRLLDLFCCQGGAAMGYHRAGFDVVGVDIEPQPRYPFEFVQADALEYLAEHGREYDAIHASPPCQGYSVATLGNPGARERHPRLIGKTRRALRNTGLPYVIENVTGAKTALASPLLLCGSMFDLRATDLDGTPLRLERHRWFESNIFMMSPANCWHDPAVQVGGVYGGGSHDRRRAKEVRRGGYTPVTSVRAELMGIDRMSGHGLSQSIPPAYTEYIGAQLIEHVRERAA